MGPWARKTAALEQDAKKSHSPAGWKEVAETAMDLIAQLGGERPEESQRLAGVALVAARKSNNAALMRKAKTVSAQVESRRNAKGP